MSATLMLSLAGIAALDSLNPSLFIAQFYLLTTTRPVPRIISYIAGIVLVNFVGGVLILSGARTLIVGWLSSLSATTWYGTELLLGLGLVLFGLWLCGASATTPSVKQPRSLRPLHTFALGMVVMLNEITTALPYFVAIERIASAQLSLPGNLLSLLLYNLIFSLPLLLFLLLFVTLRQRFVAQLDRITRGVQRWTARLIRYGLIVCGAVLLLDAAWYFVTGAGLWG